MTFLDKLPDSDATPAFHNQPAGPFRGHFQPILYGGPPCRAEDGKIPARSRGIYPARAHNESRRELVFRGLQAVQANSDGIGVCVREAGMPRAKGAAIELPRFPVTLIWKMENAADDSL